MGKANKNNQLFQSLKKQISKLEDSISNIDSDISKIVEEGIWDSTTSKTTINKLNKQMNINKDLIMSLNEICDYDISYDIKF